MIYALIPAALSALAIVICSMRARGKSGEFLKPVRLKDIQEVVFLEGRS